MKHIKRFSVTILIATVAIGLLCGPGATWLQARHAWIAPTETWDAVYLVCGARAQERRIAALCEWLDKEHDQLKPDLMILVGNDSQKSLWCRKHQTNHTRAEWTVEQLQEQIPSGITPSTKQGITIVSGSFANTDGEMIALACFLDAHPEIEAIALTTSRFHSRRLLQRFRLHAGEDIEVGIVPGISYWENRAPWIVLGEYLKLLRDRLGLTNHLTRSL
jgi:hypothetical protein